VSRSTLFHLAPTTARLLSFSLRTRAFRGYRDWNICCERVFEYGETFRILRANRPRRILDVAGDISLFGCFVAEALETPVDIVDMGSLDYCAEIRERMSGEAARLVTVIPHTRAEQLPRGRRYDAIYCISSIEHLDGDADLRFMESIGDLLNDGGVLIVTAPFTTGPETERKYRSHTYYDAHGETQSAPHFYMRYYSRGGIDELARRSGLHVERLVFAGEIVNFCEPVFGYGTDGAGGPISGRLRAYASRVIGALSPLYPFLCMRVDDDATSFSCGPRRVTPCNPDTFLLVLRK
jgi:SAM-dependent methyltransferase